MGSRDFKDVVALSKNELWRHLAAKLRMSHQEIYNVISEKTLGFQALA